MKKKKRTADVTRRVVKHSASSAGYTQRNYLSCSMDLLHFSHCFRKICNLSEKLILKGGEEKQNQEQRDRVR